MQSLRSQHADSLAQVESGYMPHSLVTCTRLAFLILASYFCQIVCQFVCVLHCYFYFNHLIS